MTKSSRRLPDMRSVAGGGADGTLERSPASADAPRRNPYRWKAAATLVASVPVGVWFFFLVVVPDASGLVLVLLYGVPAVLGWWYPRLAGCGFSLAAGLGVLIAWFSSWWFDSRALFLGLLSLFSVLPLASALLFLVARRRETKVLSGTHARLDEHWDNGA